MKELEDLQSSIKQLNGFVEREKNEENDKRGLLERQIMELRSKNEQLAQENERLREKVDPPKKEAFFGEKEVEEALVVLNEDLGNKDNDKETGGGGRMEGIIGGKPGHNRRKSVTFLDPFEEGFCGGQGNARGGGPEKDLRVGDKVVWNFEGRPELGTVKWKGFVGSEINVGVEFVRYYKKIIS